MPCDLIAFAIPIGHFQQFREYCAVKRSEGQSIFKYENYKEFEKQEGLDRGCGGLV